MKNKLGKGGIIVVLFFATVISFPSFTSARIGVGVGNGKIQVDKQLKAGGIYELPALPVLNTGDEPGEYGVSVEFQEDAPELRPSREWFAFEPANFSLQPGEVKLVKVKLTLPVKTEPGDYFAYLEGHPIKKSEAGKTSIGVAAAAKLYFTVAPANFFQGLYYRFASLYTRYHPWDTVALSAILVAALAVLAGKKLKIQVVRK